MNKKAIALIIGSALAVPSAFAAQDTSGMHFTSASEGFYASIRAAFESGASSTAGGNIQDSSSRFGVRGTNDLGGGLEGFYQYEAGVDIDNGGDLSTRLGHVGLRGSFGEVIAGGFWANNYNWVGGATDIANWNSGSLIYTDERVARTTKSLQYTTPDLNGFQAAVLIRSDDQSNTTEEAVAGTDAVDASERVCGTAAAPGTASAAPVAAMPSSTVTISAAGAFADCAAGAVISTNAKEAVPATAEKKESDENDIDSWNLAAQYNIQGFSIAGSYNNIVDGINVKASEERSGAQITNTGKKDDLISWTVKVGYAQDNWYVNGWYGEDNNSDGPTYTREAVNAKPKDSEYFSIAAGVAIDKVNLYALYEQSEKTSIENNATFGRSVEASLGTLGVQYNLGAQSRVWIEYAARDDDTDSDVGDSVHIGLQHDF